MQTIIWILKHEIWRKFSQPIGLNSKNLSTCKTCIKMQNLQVCAKNLRFVRTLGNTQQTTLINFLCDEEGDKLSVVSYIKQEVLKKSRTNN
jgi:hypothetical protein